MTHATAFDDRKSESRFVVAPSVEALSASAGPLGRPGGADLSAGLSVRQTLPSLPLSLLFALLLPSLPPSLHLDYCCYPIAEAKQGDRLLSLVVIALCLKTDENLSCFADFSFVLVEGGGRARARRGRPQTGVLLCRRLLDWNAVASLRGNDFICCSLLRGSSSVGWHWRMKVIIRSKWGPLVVVIPHRPQFRHHLKSH